MTDVQKPAPFEVVLDCEKLVHPLTGFAETLRQLRKAFAHVAPDHVTFRPMYPSKLRDFQPLPGERPIVVPRWRKASLTEPFVPILEHFGGSPGRRVWHTTTQLAKYMPLERRTPLLLTVNDLSVTRVYDEAYAARKLSQLQRLIGRAARITTISAFVADELRHHLDVGDRRIDVVYLAPSALPEPSPPRPTWLDDRPVLFTIGVVTARKNLHVLPPMLAHLPGYHLVVAGKADPDYAARLRRLAAERGVGDRFTLTGPVSENERAWLYRQGDAFLFPTLAEGFGLPALDALQAGTPAFVARNTCLPEIVGDAGFYWDDYRDPAAMAEAVGRGLEAVARDPEAHAARGRARAAEFTWERTARRYLSIYEEMVADCC